MKTIAFYSYKGGVGRSLALVNIANRLAEFGKKVCVIDFDLEAPGLDCKYHVKNHIKKGLVDYIYKFALDQDVTRIKDYSIKVPVPSTSKSIQLIPAGNTQLGDYWKKLSRINWWDLFYKEDSQGMEFFLNMKEEIKQTLDPDYLLIDNRTGITETSSLTMSLLADRVVVLAANNRENMDGSKRIINSLTAANNIASSCDIHFVLTRVPYPETIDFEKDNVTIKQKYQEVRQIAIDNNKELASTNVIHSYRELEEDETNAYYKGFFSEKNNIDTEYFELYNSLTKNDFTEQERRNFEKEIKFNNSLQKLNLYLRIKNSSSFFELSNKLLEEYKDESSKIQKIRESILLFYFTISSYEEAIYQGLLIREEDSKNWMAIDIVSRSYLLLGKRINAYEFLKEFDYEDIPDWNVQLLKLNSEWFFLDITDNNIEMWISQFNQLIKQYPQEEEIYNAKACLLRKINKYDEALKEVYKALELNNEFYLGYTTLAEIKYSQGDKDGFYQNLELSFKYGFKINNVIYDDAYHIYRSIKNEERFQNLLKKYDQVINFD